MGEDGACRDEPDVAKGLEQRENRGVHVCSRPQRKAASSAVVASAARAAGAFAVSIPSIGLSNAKQISPTKWVVISPNVPKHL